MKMAWLRPMEIDMSLLRIGILLLLSSQVGAAFAHPAGSQVKTTETSLGKLVPGNDPSIRIVSPDNHHLAYLVAKSGKFSIVLDGKPGKEYDAILKRTISFSPDSQQLVYAAKSGDTLYLVLNGNEQALLGELAPPAFSRNPLFSPDSRHLAYIIKRGDKYLVVRDGVEGNSFDGIVMAAYSPDSQKLAYPAKTANRSFMVLDAAAGKQYTGVGMPQFSSDSQHLFYTATIDSGSRVVDDQHEGKLYNMLGGISLSPDGRHVAYQAVNDQHRTLVVLDNVEGHPYHGGTNSPIRFSPDSNHVAYVASHGNNLMFVVLDGVDQKEYPIIIDVYFSPDSHRLAYRTKKNSLDVVTVNGVEGAGFRSIDDLSLVFSPDSKRLAYKAISGNKELIVLDGAKSPQYAAVGYPLFTADSKHIVFAAADSKGWHLTVDNKLGNAFSEFLNRNRLGFDGAGKFSFLAIRKGEVFRVEVEIGLP